MTKRKPYKRDYKKHLDTPAWRGVCQYVKMRDGFKCKICETKTRPLECHHTTYTVGGVSIVGKEAKYLSLIVTLCDKCHAAVHSDKLHRLNPCNFINK